MFRTNRTLTILNEMLDAANSGRFEESAYDETRLSALETKWKRFLTTSKLSAHKIEENQNNIKSLISDISHQTKTPMANILLYTQLVKERNKDESLLPLIEQIESQTDKLQFLMQSLVKTSRLENDIFVLTPKEQFIGTMLKSVVEQIQAEADKKQITVVLSVGEEKAHFDRKWTEEAVFNLADNAVKYSGEHTTIEISVKRYELFTVIMVRDQGMGIREDEQAQIFGRFYRGREVTEEKGVGIGLHLAREIVSKQNGYIKVSSEYGKGSVFSLYLSNGMQ